MNVKKTKTQLWLNLTIFTLFLIVFNIFFIIFIKNHYYNFAQQNLNFSANYVNFQIESIEHNDSIFLNSEIKKIIENFKNENKMAAIGFNSDGKAIVASNKNFLKPYNNLLKLIKQKKLNLKKMFQLKLPNGEHMMLKIKPITQVNCEFSKIIYILPLKKFDRLILKNSLICLIVSFIIVGAMVLTGLFFIKKLLKPIIEINGNIKKMKASKINSLKIPENFNHELSVLAHNINTMNRQLRNSEYAQNEFISSISHELRTPLTAITGWSETILNSNLDEKILTKGIKIISKEIARLSKMVEELLDFSKIRNGHLKLFKEKMDPFAELQDVILIYNKIAKEQNKKIIYKEQATIPIIFGDRNRIKQIYINIIDNALKYSNKGATINIEAIMNEKTADVIVKDNGIGIAQHNLNKITKKFFKASNSKSGSGIGLSIVKDIVLKHGGTLNFKSAQNRGTTVKISLPLFTQTD